MPATRDGKLWRSQFYYKDWQGVRRKKNKRGYVTGWKGKGMDTRVSLKQALKSLGFQGGNKHDTELNQWINHEKEVLGLMNGIKACAEEIVLKERVYM